MPKKKNEITRFILKSSMLFALVLMLGLLAMGNSSKAAVKYYKISGKWVGFDKSKGKITWHGGITYIPKKIAGKKVKIIGDAAFWNSKLKTAKIPSTVKKIGKSAFGGCKKLKTVKIPSSVKSIGRYAFGEDLKLTKVVFPKGFKMKSGYIADNSVFWGSNKLKTVVNNPDSKWRSKIKTFEKTLKYLKTQNPDDYVKNVREAKNQWVPNINADGHHDYTDEEWNVVAEKAKSITKGCKTKMAMAKKISKWIEKNITYDDYWMKQFKEWRKTHDPENEAFPLKKYTDAYNLIKWDKSEHDGKSRMTTCGGYGNTTQAMFAAVGIPCVHVWRVQKAGEDIDHVFNVAYISGKWRWIDNTYTDKNLNFFDCGIAGFAASDHRCDELNLVDLDELINSAGKSSTVKTSQNIFLKEKSVPTISGISDRFMVAGSGDNPDEEIEAGVDHMHLRIKNIPRILIKKACKMNENMI